MIPLKAFRSSELVSTTSTSTTTQNIDKQDRSYVISTDRTFGNVEDKLAHALEGSATYYKNNYLKLNPTDARFLLKNKEAHMKLNVVWRDQELEHKETPKY